MPVDILRIRVTDQINSLPADTLRGGVGSLYRVEIDAYFHDELIGVEMNFDSPNDRIIFPDGGIENTSIRAGSTIRIFGTTSNNGNYTVTNISDTYIECSGASFITENNASANIYDTTPIKRIEYYSGIVGNGEGDNSFTKLDQVSQMRWLGKPVDNTPTTFTPFTPYTGKRHWISAKASLEALIGVTWVGVGTTNVSTGFEQEFKIVDYFHIPPYLEEQFNGGQLDINLIPYFLNTEALRFVPKIDIGNAGNIMTASTDDGNIDAFLFPGETGWYDETGNGQAQQFTIQSVVFTDPNSGGAVGTLKANGTTHVVVEIAATGGTFAAGDNKGRVGFAKVVSESEYLDPINSMAVNMVYDAENISSIAPNPPGLYMTNISYTFTAGDMVLEFDFTPDASMNVGDRFLLFMDAQDTDEDSLAVSNKTTLLISNGLFVEYINVEDLGESRTLICEHPYGLALNGYTEYKGWIHDDILVIHELDVNDESAPGIPQSLSYVELAVEVQKGSEIFELFKSVKIYPGDSGTIGYQYGTGNIKNEYSLDTGTVGAGLTTYTLNHGLKLRFEDWLGQFNAPAFFAGSQTKNWSNYFELLLVTGWQPYIVVYEHRQTDGQEVVKRHISLLSPLNNKEYNDCPVFLNIETYGDVSGNNLGGKISKTENTFVIARFTGNGLNCYDFLTTDFWGFIEWYYKGLATDKTAEQVSSVVSPKVNNGWLGLSAGLATVTKVAFNEVTVEAVLLSTDPRFSSENCVTLWSRLGKLGEFELPVCNLPDDITVEADCVIEPLNLCDHPEMVISFESDYGVTLVPASVNIQSWDAVGGCNCHRYIKDSNFGATPPVYIDNPPYKDVVFSNDYMIDPLGMGGCAAQENYRSLKTGREQTGGILIRIDDTAFQNISHPIWRTDFSFSTPDQRSCIIDYISLTGIDYIFRFRVFNSVGLEILTTISLPVQIDEWNMIMFSQPDQGPATMYVNNIAATPAVYLFPADQSPEIYNVALLGGSSNCRFSLRLFFEALKNYSASERTFLFNQIQNKYGVFPN